jgi:hypothetical protein
VGHGGALTAQDWGGAMAVVAVDGGQWGGGGPVRRLSSGKEMLGKRKCGNE